MGGLRRTRLIVLAVSGRAKGYRIHVRTHWFQQALCSPGGLRETVAHHFSRCSKGTLTEHRLFSAICSKCAGQPLVSFEAILCFIRTTPIKAGLRVLAKRISAACCTGINIHPPQRGSSTGTRPRPSPSGTASSAASPP